MRPILGLILLTFSLTAYSNTDVRQDPAHPIDLRLPPQAAGLGGRCVVRIHASSAGELSGGEIKVSSGISALDAACKTILNGQRVMPATVNGVPIDKDVDIPLVFKKPPALEERPEPEDGDSRIYMAFQCDQSAGYGECKPLPNSSHVYNTLRACQTFAMQISGVEPINGRFYFSNKTESQLWVECRSKHVDTWRQEP